MKYLISFSILLLALQTNAQNTNTNNQISEPTVLKSKNPDTVTEYIEKDPNKITVYKSQNPYIKEEETTTDEKSETTKKQKNPK